MIISILVKLHILKKYYIFHKNLRFAIYKTILLKTLNTVNCSPIENLSCLQAKLKPGKRNDRFSAAFLLKNF